MWAEPIKPCSELNIQLDLGISHFSNIPSLTGLLDIGKYISRNMASLTGLIAIYIKVV